MIKIIVEFRVNDTSWVNAMLRVKAIFASLSLPNGIDIIEVKDGGDSK